MFRPCKSEQQFSKSLLAAFKRSNIECYRIESGETAVGIPDIYCMTLDCWLELKNDKLHTRNQTLEVHWRPGQQSFALQYLRAHNNKRCTFTIVRLTDCIAVIPMTKRFSNNIVSITDITYCDSFMEVIVLLRRYT